MQAFVVDPLTQEEIRRLAQVLPQYTKPSSIEGLYWIPLPEEFLAPVQKEHKDCQPHYLAVELGEDFISFEFLVRNFQRVRCDCICPATNPQKLFILELAKKIFASAGIPLKRG